MKPILFNTEMVRALLEGTKTVTRRVVKPQPGNGAHSPYECVGGRFAFRIGDRACTNQYKPPYRPGDILYVRETFQIDYLSNIQSFGKIHYKADDAYSDFTFESERYEMMRRAQLKPGWRPNENMPREAARIFLRVTGVRVERLQNITDDGIVRDFDFCAEALKTMNAQQKNVACMALWDSTIKKADRALYGWDADPWVWVIEFERCEKPEEREVIPNA